MPTNRVPRTPIPRVSVKREAKLRAANNGQLPFRSVSTPRKPATPRTPIKKAPRPRAETLRIYGTPERRAWIKRQPCLYCVMACPILRFAEDWSCHNAHTVSGGKGRKADAHTIVPLCTTHHRWYDEHRNALANPAIRQLIIDAAATYDAAWQNHLTRGTLPPMKYRGRVSTDIVGSEVEFEFEIADDELHGCTSEQRAAIAEERARELALERIEWSYEPAAPRVPYPEE